MWRSAVWGASTELGVSGAMGLQRVGQGGQTALLQEEGRGRETRDEGPGPSRPGEHRELSWVPRHAGWVPGLPTAWLPAAAEPSASSEGLR